VWCVPPATHVPRIHRSQKKVLGRWMLVFFSNFSVLRQKGMSQVWRENRKFENHWSEWWVLQMADGGPVRRHRLIWIRWLKAMNKQTGRFLWYLDYWDIVPIFFSWFDSPSRHRPPCRGFEIALGQTTPCRTPLDEWSARCRDLYLTTHNTHKRQTSMLRRDSNPQFSQASGRKSKP